MPEPTAPARGTDPVAATFRERLRPSAAYLVGAVCVGFMLGLTLWLFSPVLTLVVGAVAAVVLAVVLWAASPVVAVGPGPDGAPWLWAGRARIPVALLAAPRALDAAALRAELGPGSDARTFACLRPWVRAAVHVRVVDPEDPTPGWLVGSRRPAELEAALLAAGARPVQQGDGRENPDHENSDEHGAGPERGTAATRG
ncbi:DUF3093 family protein [Luteimicrobium sp. DT211]|uniref:DUF3093 family protein n=1 Tax=Luteimicrobium sp. DT211 TaxID=3393412 RepID=UPI003CEB99D6